MNSGRLRHLWVSLALCGCAAPAISAQTPPPPATGSSTARLSDLDRVELAWLQAYERHDPKAMDSILAADFTITYPKGRVLTRTDVMAQVSRPASARQPRFTTEDVRTRRWGNVAVRTGVLVTETSRGRTRNRYTDTWMRQKGRWRVVASHLSDLAEN